MSASGLRQGLELTAWVGEREHLHGHFLAARAIDLCDEQGMRMSCLLRGAEGFGAAQRLQTQRLLTLSEDLPLAVVALDERARVEALLERMLPLQRSGLLTLAPAELLDGEPTAPEDSAGGAASEETKLTLALGRQERAGGRPAHVAAVAALHEAGVAGATVLLGVDGTLDGVRRRASFLGRNQEVPLMVTAVGEHARIAEALGRLGTLAAPHATLARVRVCKRDGVLLGPPHAPGEAPSAGDGLETWQRLTVYASEQSRHDGGTLHTALIRRLRAEGAAGATALRGIWGYHGDHAPHGDRVRSLRRRVPMVTVAVDTPERAAGWFAIADELTDATGLVTSELVWRVSAPGPRQPSEPSAL